MSAPLSTPELHRLVAEALDAEPEDFGPEENLVELGLSSIVLMKLRARLAERGAGLAFADMMAEPTVAAWSRLIAAAPATPEEAGAGEPEDPFAPFPLTAVQRAYWLGREPCFSLGGVAAHGYIEAVAGDLDVPRLRAALDATVADHPMLRAVIAADGSQRVLRAVPPCPLAEEDLSALPPEARTARLEQIRAGMEQEVRPADQWPLFHIRLSRVSPREHVLHIGFDILVFDLKSLEIWVDHWWRHYAGTLPEPQAGAGDFRSHVMEQEARRAAPARDAALAYWRGRIADLPLGPELPLAVPLEKLAPPRFARVQRRLPRATWERLAEAARARGLSPSSALLAAYARVLAAWSREPRFSVMTTLFTRASAARPLDMVIGDFTALTLVEVDTAAPPTFAALSQAAQQQLWRDLDHATVSGVEVLALLGAAHDAPNAALAPYVFTSALGTGRSYLDAFARFGRITHAAVQTPQTLIDHQVLEHEGDLVLNWDHVAEAFPPGLVADMADLHLWLLEQLSAGAAWDAPELELLPPGQKPRPTGAQVPPLTAAAPFRLLHEPFLHQARARPEAVAVIDGPRRITYGALDAASTRLAHTLRERGARTGELVAVLAPRGWEQVAAVLAVLKTGAAYLPVDPALPPRRIETLLREGCCRLALLAEGQPLPGFGPTAVMPVRIDAALLDAGAPAPVADLPAIGADDLAYVIFTSGSTGTPKGVMMAHGATLNTVLDINARTGAGPRDRALMVSSLSFDLSVYDIFGLLGAGGGVVIPPAGAPDPEAWRVLVTREGVSVWNSVPALLQLLVDHLDDRGRPGDIDPLRLVLLSGDVVPPPLCRRILSRARPPRLIALGGATEAAIWSIAHEVTAPPPDERPIPYGRALTGQSIHVLDAHMAERPDFAVGEIHIGGAGLAQGYWSDAERTAARFIRHPATGARLYRTGDLGCRHPDGTVAFLGREDGQAKLNGLRVELGEIESLMRGAGLAAAFAVLLRAGARGDRLVAFAVAREGEALDEDAVRAHLCAHLPAALVPVRILPLERAPLSANGKVDRAALVALAHQAEHDAPPGLAAAGPADPLEAQMCAIWSDLLGITVDDVNTHFFRAGGNSLLATRLAGRLTAALGHPVSVLKVFEHPVLRALARHLSGEKAPAAPARAEMSQRTDTRRRMAAERARMRER